MSLTNEQKKLVQSTAYIMKDHGQQILQTYFVTLFKEHPEFRNYFNETNQKTGKQSMTVAQTIFYFIDNLDNLDVMVPQMSRIASKHRAMMVKPEHYPIVGKYLLQTIKEYLSDAATPELIAAWGALLDLMGSILIEKEKELYDKIGGDEREKGFIPFSILKKEIIASGPLYSLTLAREDGGKLFDYQPGQYITLRIEKDGLFQNGHYTLIEPFNGSSYTVAFKQGFDSDQNSIVSDEIIDNRAIGSTILVSPPAGSFALANDAKHHLFISGGIGIASYMAMIQDLYQQGKAASATLIQCVRAEDHAAFADKLRNIFPKGQYIILTEKDPLSKTHLEGKLHPDTHVYLSGSEMFLTMAEDALVDFAHPKTQIHMKSIEPTLRLLKNIDLLKNADRK